LVLGRELEGAHHFERRAFVMEVETLVAEHELIIELASSWFLRREQDINFPIVEFVFKFGEIEDVDFDQAKIKFFDDLFQEVRHRRYHSFEESEAQGSWCLGFSQRL
jgi:hypothetical protein